MLLVGVVFGGRLRSCGRSHYLQLRLLVRTLIFGIGRSAHRQHEAELGSPLLAVAGLDVAVMQAAEGAGIEQTYSGPQQLVPAGGLVETVEYLVHVFRRYAGAAVAHAYAGVLAVGVGIGQRELGCRRIPGYHVEAQRYLSSLGRELEGVGQQVHDHLLHLVCVHPHGEGILEAIGAELDTLRLGVVAEQVRDVLQRPHNIHLGHLHVQLAVADTVEVQQLVHQGQHPRGVAVDNVHQLAVLTLDSVGTCELLGGAGNHGKRSPELMRHIGEIIHLDTVEGLFRLLRFLGLFPFAPFLTDVEGRQFAHPANVAPESVGYGTKEQCQHYVCKDCPPAPVPRRQHRYIQRLNGFRNGVAGIRDTDKQTVLSGRDAGEISVVTGTSLDPVGIESLQLVGITYLLVAAVVQSREGDIEAVLAVPDGNVGLFGEQLVYRALLGRNNDAVMYGQVFEDKGNGAPGRSVQRVEPCDAVRTAEYQDAVRKYA